MSVASQPTPHTNPATNNLLKGVLTCNLLVSLDKALLNSVFSGGFVRGGVGWPVISYVGRFLLTLTVCYVLVVQIMFLWIFLLLEFLKDVYPPGNYIPTLRYVWRWCLFVFTVGHARSLEGILGCGWSLETWCVIQHGTYGWSLVWLAY